MEETGAEGRSSLGGLRLGEENPIAIATGGAADAMSFKGVAVRTLLLLQVVIVVAAIPWATARAGGEVGGYFWLGFAGAIVTSMSIAARPDLAPTLGWVYAASEGACVGALASVADAYEPGAALNAFLLTVALLGAMLVLHVAVRPAKRRGFRDGVIAITVAIGIFYILDLVTWAVGGQGLALLHQTGFLTVAISVAILGVAALNLTLDFEFVEEQIERGAPRDMEWFAAVSIVITLIWVFVEALRLFMQLGGDDD